MPYDAEVEYIERTSGNARIDLGFNDFAVFEITAQATATASSSMIVLSCNSGGGGGTWFGVPPNVNNVWGLSNVSGAYSNVSSLNKTVINVDFTVNPVAGSIGENTFTRTRGTVNTNWYLFGTNSGGYPFTGKIFKLKAYVNNVLVRDMIPVRVEQVGYLYDRVSEELFGNDGTGSFTIGPDKNAQ